MQLIACTLGTEISVLNLKPYRSSVISFRMDTFVDECYVVFESSFLSRPLVFEFDISKWSPSPASNPNFAAVGVVV